MKYLKWLLYAIVDFLFTLQCYVTNPIVVLFADELGSLPFVLRYWQTWDNTLDVEWMVTEKHVPKLFQYNYAKHYVYHKENHNTNVVGHVNIIDKKFSLWEKVQRYFCRVAWLYRNTGYGFSYEVTGIDVDGADIVRVRDEKYGEYRYQYYKTKNAFVLRYEHPWNDRCKWRIFLGWKMQDMRPMEKRRCMLALYFNPFWRI